MTELTLHIPIPAEHPSFAGHFPGRPLLPGAVLLDVIATALEAAHKGWRVNVFSNIKFPAPVRPGDSLALHYRFTRGADGAGAVVQLRATSRTATVCIGRLELAPVAP